MDSDLDYNLSHIFLMWNEKMISESFNIIK